MLRIATKDLEKLKANCDYKLIITAPHSLCKQKFIMYHFKMHSTVFVMWMLFKGTT